MIPDNIIVSLSPPKDPSLEGLPTAYGSPCDIDGGSDL